MRWEPLPLPLFLLATALLTLTVWACDEGTGPATVATVEVTPATDTLAALGATVRFTAVARSESGESVSGKVFTWSTANPAVASVHDSTGEALAIANGSAAITATTDGVSGSATLHVLQSGAALALVTQPVGGPAGEALATQPTLEVRDANGNVVTNDNSTVVTGVVASDGASVTAGATATAVAGIVSFTDLAVGGLAGSHTLRFEADAMSAATSAAFTVDPGPPTAMALSAGNDQTGLAATEIADSLAVEVQDAYGNPSVGVEVNWSSRGEGTLALPTSESGASGVARNSYTLGAHAGVDTVMAAVEGLDDSPIRFALTATPNATISGTVAIPDGDPVGSSPLAQDRARRTGLSRAAVRGPHDVVWPDAPPADGAGARHDIRPRFAPGELLVAFTPSAVGAPSADRATGLSLSAAREVSQTIRSRIAALEPALAAAAGVSPAIATARVRVDDPGRLDRTAARLRSMPGVARVARNPMLYSYELPAPPAPFPANDWYYAYQAWHYGIIDMPAAWTMTTGSRSVLVAVVDDGIRFDHADIAANLTDDGYDFVDDQYTFTDCAAGELDNALDGDGYDPDPTIPADYTYDSNDECFRALSTGGHGLHVAGTIGAVGNDGNGMTGVNWDVLIRPIRVLGAAGGSAYEIMQGVLYAAGLPADDGDGGTVQAPSRADVINLSLGGPSGGETLQSAFAAAAATGALIIAGAGNSANDDPKYPAAFPSTVSVSAIGPDRQLATYSSYGSTVDITAPGGDWYDGGWDHGVWSLRWNFDNDSPLWGAYHGTSMAAPHVSGVAALLLAYDPSLTADQLRARLLDYAIDLGDPGRDDLFGHGLVNARNSLTGTHAPAVDHYARLYDQDWQVRSEAPVGADGSFAFDELPDGEYYVFAGADRGGDGMIGLPGRGWGAFSQAASPSPVAIDGAGTYGGIDFATGYPWEIEPNQDMAQASLLPVGGWIRGGLEPDADTGDFYRVVIPADGLYTFETLPKEGACGFAREEDTILRLYDAGGAVLAEIDDIDTDGLDFCSRISREMTAGTYYLEVTGVHGGRYHLQARTGG